MKIERTSDINTILINGIPMPAIMVAKGNENGTFSLMSKIGCGKTSYCNLPIGDKLFIDGVQQTGYSLEDVVIELNSFVGLGFKGGGGGTNPGVSPTDHNSLTGRSAQNAHPIAAITNLQNYIENYISLKNETPDPDVTVVWLPKQ